MAATAITVAAMGITAAAMGIMAAVTGTTAGTEFTTAAGTMVDTFMEAHTATTADTGIGEATVTGVVTMGVMSGSGFTAGVFQSTSATEME